MYVLVLMLVGMSVSDYPCYILLFTLGFGFFNALNRIARTNWLHNTVKMSQRGRVDGGFAMFTMLVQSIGYAVIAVLSHYQITHLGFILAAITVLLASIMMSILSTKATTTFREVVSV